MSWSFSFAGKPAALTEAVKKFGEGLTGDSKEEFYDALPHILGVLGQNYVSSKQVYQQAYTLKANGHGYSGSRSCSVTLEPLGYSWVELTDALDR